VPVRALQGQQACTPAHAGDAATFCCDRFGGGIGQIAHYLPADRRIALKQPLDYIHVSTL
jgi:hypothetical protein